MSDEQTALVRVQKNELELAERKIDVQIARVRKNKWINPTISFSGIGVMAAGLAGLVLLPHVAVAAAIVGGLGMVGGVVKEQRDRNRISEGNDRRYEIRSQQQDIAQDRMERLEEAAINALETERNAGTLAMGREMLIGFEDEKPKVLRIEEIGNVLGDDQQIHQRIGGRLYDGTFIILRVVKDFEPMVEAAPPSLQPAQPEKRLPPCAPA